MRHHVRRSSTRALMSAGAAAAAAFMLAAAPGASAVPAPGAGGLAAAPPAPQPAVEQPVQTPPRGTPEYARWYAAGRLADFGWKQSEMDCLVPMWTGESHWDYREVTGRYIGIPQTTIGVVEGFGVSAAEYRSSAEAQVDVGLRYIDERYGSPCRAWAFWKAQGAWQDGSDPQQWWGGWY